MIVAVVKMSMIELAADIVRADVVMGAEVEAEAEAHVEAEVELR